MLYSKRIKSIIHSYTSSIGAAAVVLCTSLVSFDAGALSLGDASVETGIEAARGNDVPSMLIGDGGVLSMIINTMLFVVGFLSVVMLIFGGIRYVVSGGNSTSVTSAKNTILYAIVGLLVSLFAYAIINFVTDSLAGGGTGGTNL